jgi:lysozyme family protein
MARFDLYYPKLAIHEGGYVNDPVDKGGETYKGVARNFNPTWDGWPIVDAYVKQAGGTVKRGTVFKDATLDRMVYNLFLQKYWLSAGFDLINNQSLAEILADWKINGGLSGERIKPIQRMIGTTADGVWGKMSSQAVNSYATTAQRAKMLFDTIVSIREAQYRASGDFWKFGKGWLDRLSSFTLDFNKSNAFVFGGIVLLGLGLTAYLHQNKQLSL